MKKSIGYLLVTLGWCFFIGIYISLSESFKTDERTRSSISRAVSITKKNLGVKELVFLPKYDYSYSLELDKQGNLFIVIDSLLAEYQYSAPISNKKKKTKLELVYIRSISSQHKLDISKYFNPQRKVNIKKTRMVLTQHEEGSNSKTEIFDTYL